MKLICALIFILGVTSACKKQMFTSPSGFENLYGTWKSVSGDIEDNIIISNKGYIEYKVNLERSRKYQLISAVRKNINSLSGNFIWDEYFLIRTNVESHGNLTLHFSPNYDTIRGSSGAFSHSANDLDYARAYVKL